MYIALEMINYKPQCYGCNAKKGIATWISYLVSMYTTRLRSIGLRSETSAAPVALRIFCIISMLTVPQQRN